MTSKYEVGELYTAKSYLESGYNFYNFPERGYKLKIIHEGFPINPINKEEELVVAKEIWLEGLEGTEQYQVDLEINYSVMKRGIA